MTSTIEPYHAPDGIPWCDSSCPSYAGKGFDSACAHHMDIPKVPDGSGICLPYLRHMFGAWRSGRVLHLPPGSRIVDGLGRDVLISTGTRIPTRKHRPYSEYLDSVTVHTGCGNHTAALNIEVTEGNACASAIFRVLASCLRQWLRSGQPEPVDGLCQACDGTGDGGPDKPTDRNFATGPRLVEGDNRCPGCDGHGEYRANRPCLRCQGTGNSPLGAGLCSRCSGRGFDRRWVPCEECNQTGASATDEGENPDTEPCPGCDGDGIGDPLEDESHPDGACIHCGGTGVYSYQIEEDEYHDMDCDHCDGEGKLEPHRTTVTLSCRRCNGAGTDALGETTCDACDGTGTVEVARTKQPGGGVRLETVDEQTDLRDVQIETPPDTVATDCPNCEGTGSDVDCHAGLIRCSYCKGTGRVVVVGAEPVQKPEPEEGAPCPHCDGLGSIPSGRHVAECLFCGGTGSAAG